LLLRNKANIGVVPLPLYIHGFKFPQTNIYILPRTQYAFLIGEWGFMEFWGGKNLIDVHWHYWMHMARKVEPTPLCAWANISMALVRKKSSNQKLGQKSFKLGLVKINYAKPTICHMLKNLTLFWFISLQFLLLK